MPGRQPKHFRPFNLGEHLGLLLLKGVAAIAEVSRLEDFGLDAVATLLRSDGSSCYAEDSFSVQIKSGSVKPLRYRGHELEWLVGQTLPMFIGLVSLRDSQISLYPTLFINHAALMLHAEKVTVRFGRSNLPAFLVGQTWQPWKGESDGSATVWLGEPLLRWTLRDLTDSEWAKRSYGILKRYLGIASRERELLSLRQLSVIEWATNDADSIKTHFGTMTGHRDELNATAERCAPYLQALMLRAISLQGDAGNELMMSLLVLAKSLRKIGAEVDPENLFGKFFSVLRKE